MRDSGGQWLDGEGSIRHEFVTFFRSRWITNVEGGDSFVIRDPLSQITDQENRELTWAVSTKEIRRMLLSMTKNKAPELDGFSPLFFCRFWPII